MIRSKLIRYWKVALGFLLAVMVTTYLIWSHQEQVPQEEESVYLTTTPDPVPVDPRLQTAVPFRNVRPEIRYVGDAACAECHADIAATYRQHPMGRSATMDLNDSPLERWQQDLKVEQGPYRLGIVYRQKQWWHTLTLAGSATPVEPVYAARLDVGIGSGTRGRSYLTFEQNALWQSPLSWFSNTACWDVSPGFDLGRGGRRPVGPDCLFCHVHYVDPVPGAINRYQEPLFSLQQAAIGCERCHGPGELHVQERLAGLTLEGMDTSIVNPRHLEAERQQDVCRQCHLQGQARVPQRGRHIWEYRPSLPWDQFVVVCLRHPDWTSELRSVGQFEQMEQSRCYRGSRGRLLCTSCHDPHSVPPPAQRLAHYRQRCLQCHQSQGCSLPSQQRQVRQDNCVACHMPARPSGNIAHASITDHRILRRPAATGSEDTSSQQGVPATLPLIVYRQSQPPAEPDQLRALAIALARLSSQVPAVPQNTPWVEWAVQRLENAIALHCGDVEAWIALCEARLALGQLSLAWQAVENALQLRSNQEQALRLLAEIALALRRWDRAEPAIEQLIRLNPSSADYFLLLAALRLAQKQGQLAERACQRALTIHPWHPQVHLYLAVSRFQLGDAMAAQQALERALQLATTPQQRQQYHTWYRQQTQKQ
ncbi:MAG: hypothetical protein NZU63_09205 [Gemmataceae bacterium]|nr:hypothetical protein [Gemmataceae bacterium]